MIIIRNYIAGMIIGIIALATGIISMYSRIKVDDGCDIEDIKNGLLDIGNDILGERTIH
jgi:hypothetical protein